MLTVPTDTISLKFGDFMSCFHPLKAFYTFNSDGKKSIRFYNNSYSKPYESYPDEHKISIPCGQCAGCRLDYSKQWAIRCMLEARNYEHNYFITLTYDNEHLPIQSNPHFSRETGEVFSFFDSAPLVPEHLTKFLKDLRRYFKYHYDFDGIRFFACGEYGEKFMRPHFHIILFNCPIPDLELLKTSFNGDLYWRSNILENIWKKGFVCVGSCNYNTCSYVARYMMKKQKGLHSHFYSDNGLVAPFTRSSRDPGIGRSYYDKNRDKIFEYDNLVILGSDGKSKFVKPPSYFDRLYDIDNPEALKRIKSKREESAKSGHDLELSFTDLSEDDYLKVCEDIFLCKTNKLIRPVE